MRLIGGRDYYDGAMGFGQDRSVVLKRRPHAEAEPIPSSGTPLPDYGNAVVRMTGGRRFGYVRGNGFLSDGMEIRFDPLCVLLAGRRHGGFRISARVEGDRLGGASVDHCWELGTFLEKAGAYGLTPSRRDRRRFGREDRIRFDRDGLDRHFSEAAPAEVRDWMIERGVALALWDGDGGWKADTDGLKDVGFATRLDPWTAFQELATWVGGVLPRPANPTVEIRDEKTMVAKHGFDEWTFRRQSRGRT